MRRPIAAMTAIVPPELIYAAGWTALDVNNWIPASNARPRSKLCAWTASWREAILKGDIGLDALIVVAGGDCHNALADGQVAARNVPAAHFFFYPFDGDIGYLKEQMEKLDGFLRRIKGGKGEGDGRILSEIAEAKRLGMELDRKRSDGEADPQRTFKTLISFSDLEGSPSGFGTKVKATLEAECRKGRRQEMAGTPRVALIGVPPIYRDFHAVCAGAGLRVVFDELPYEFLRLGGKDIDMLAKSYSTYTFARPVEFRLELLKRELARRKVDGIIHYTQFTCHHVLEDRLIREELDRPMLTVQGDLPGATPAQIRLRLEAFGELLGDTGRMGT